MDYETVIGLEVHVQLQTQSKMFCSCRADYQAAPANTHVCPVCLGLPGALPVINKKAVEYTIMTGLALGCDIPGLTKFDRKNYPYPDLMKGYQISQYDMPLAMDGHLDITADGQDRSVRVERVHLEEDVSKLQHVNGGSKEAHSLVDVNRSGVPLMEVVSHPDMRTPEEARSYLTKLHGIIQYLGVSTANAQDGSFRCDANISLRPVGQKEYGTKTEIKNMNSMRAVFMALNHEIERQQKVLDSGDRVVQETRGWSEERNVTYSQRSKEEAHDYRYFPEPDLPPIVVDEAWIEEIRSKIPELASDRLTRLAGQFGLSEYDARLLTTSKSTADFFEQTTRLLSVSGEDLERYAKNVSNWILGDLSRLLNLRDLEIQESPVSPEHLRELITLVDDGTVSISMAKKVLEEVFESGDSPGRVVQEKGYTQISDSSVVKTAVAKAIDANPQAVTDYMGGKETAAKFLVGQVMKITKGQANPDLVNELVVRALEELR
ncbi:MAG: Asp-tRNA(Asn)/Glu-tRNA(Gln) amidotransferase subunit GatB [Chloroflexota bacterium]|nr:Asp-tRNA(Asn)/Glu-tRNA(Gln) amidotransferase subunit GatB [Chloroflexota bacterium]MEC9447333.1 Asp-tRNA(Asn)/Glu-tRNA(Gln) amidotransferase subunit GatB [Chloroflexota bacterium]MEE3248124.1 Asp-tRNA(Asn)/Glu-tRNA(Gln) amidotransferase subunit GatB [Chloroflexota bacterium]